jgi:hypothetical protein
MKTETIKWSELSERERDALVAVHVMKSHRMSERRVHPKWPDHGETISVWDEFGIEAVFGSHFQSWPTKFQGLPEYSSAISDAMAVVEKMRFGSSIEINNTRGGEWSVRIILKNDWTSQGKAIRSSLPEAICLAALRASPVPVE